MCILLTYLSAASLAAVSDSIVSVGEGADAVGEDVTLIIIGGEGFLARLESQDLMEPAADDIH